MNPTSFAVVYFSSANFSLSRDLSQSFGVYVQHLLSACVDSDFMRSIYNEKDSYFLPCIRAVEGKADLLKQLVLSSNAWKPAFKVTLSLFLFYLYPPFLFSAPLLFLLRCLNAKLSKKCILGIIKQ